MLNQHMTQPTREKDIVREWFVVDVQGKTLGRIAGDIAHLLMGKKKPYFVRNLDCGDYVIVLNARDVKVTGKKEEQKMYYRHSGYPGGFKAESLRELRSRKPEDIIRHAVKGMLPQNKLSDRMLTRLHIYAGGEHRFADKKLIVVS